jgi:hypothetical protein
MVNGSPAGLPVEVLSAGIMVIFVSGSVLIIKKLSPPFWLPEAAKYSSLNAVFGKMKEISEVARCEL